jgi:ABC-2 type transport system ATP-binding protein
MSTPAAGAPALETSGLSKSYPSGVLHRGRRSALEELTLSVPRGEVFGYLGPNGAGKTTTLKLLLGLLRADRGSARVLGVPHTERAWRYRAGYLPENPYLYDYLTPQEYLDYAGRLFGMPASERRERSAQLLRRVGLADSARVPMRRFSKGMLQRAGLAQALLNDPELVFLDEPMSGLDPIGRHMVKEVILDLRSRGRTVFFSTHILSDAESLCDRVGLLRAGRLVTVGRLDDILRIDVSHLEVLVSGVDAGLLERLRGLKGKRALGERWILEVEEKSLGPVISAVQEAGGRILSVQPVRESLEDYFIREMGAQPGGRPWEAA